MGTEHATNITAQTVRIVVAYEFTVLTPTSDPREREEIEAAILARVERPAGATARRTLRTLWTSVRGPIITADNPPPVFRPRARKTKDDSQPEQRAS